MDALNTDLSLFDFHLPKSFIGNSLNESGTKAYTELKLRFKVVLNSPVEDYEALTPLVDLIEHIFKYEIQQCMDILSNFIEYLRIHLLSTRPIVVEKTVTCLDVLVKNCGYRIHSVVGKRMFIKTLSRIGRRKIQNNLIEERRVGWHIMDTLQAWGEAFQPRRLLYPHIYGVYLNLKFKYMIQFKRPDFDPTRVPIFLGPVSAHEYDLQMHDLRSDGINTDGIVGMDQLNRDIGVQASVTSQSSTLVACDVHPYLDDDFEYDEAAFANTAVDGDQHGTSSSNSSNDMIDVDGMQVVPASQDLVVFEEAQIGDNSDQDLIVYQEKSQEEDLIDFNDISYTSSSSGPSSFHAASSMFLMPHNDFTSGRGSSATATTYASTAPPATAVSASSMLKGNSFPFSPPTKPIKPQSGSTTQISPLGYSSSNSVPANSKQGLDNDIQDLMQAFLSTTSSSSSSVKKSSASVAEKSQELKPQPNHSQSQLRQQQLQQQQQQQQLQQQQQQREKDKELERMRQDYETRMKKQKEETEALTARMSEEKRLIQQQAERDLERQTQELKLIKQQQEELLTKQHEAAENLKVQLQLEKQKLLEAEGLKLMHDDELRRLRDEAEELHRQHETELLQRHLDSEKTKLKAALGEIDKQRQNELEQKLKQKEDEMEGFRNQQEAIMEQQKLETEMLKSKLEESKRERERIELLRSQEQEEEDKDEFTYIHVQPLSDTLNNSTNSGSSRNSPRIAANDISFSSDAFPDDSDTSFDKSSATRSEPRSGRKSTSAVEALRTRKSTYVAPASDPTNEFHFFGTQRLVLSDRTSTGSVK